MTERWLYKCILLNPDTGEMCSVIVQLTETQRHDALRHLGMRGSDGPGGPDGPIARGYALQRAQALAPPGFLPTLQVNRLRDLQLVGERRVRARVKVTANIFHISTP